MAYRPLLRALLSPVFKEERHMNSFIDAPVGHSSANTTDETLRRDLRLEASEELAESIGADLCNIFAVISGTLQLRIMELGGDPAACPWTQNAIQTAARGARLASGLLEFAGPQALPQNIDLQLLLAGQLPAIRAILGAGATFDNKHKGELWWVKAQSAPICATVRALAQHALMTMQPGGSFRVTAENISGTDAAADSTLAASHPDYVSLAVAYPGSGFSAAELRDIMQPSFLVKKAADAVPLNLSSASAILRRCGGGLAIESTPGCGVSVRILLPRAKLHTRDWFGHHTTPNA
jgi:signal transduction histidine kinase